MKVVLSIILIALLTGCATTYNLPVEQRSRSYARPMEDVWDAALAAIDDVELALIETEPEHGRIRARSGGNIFDLKGYMVLIAVRVQDDGYVRVDANAEATSEETIVDFGKANRLVKKYLRALDRRLRAVAP